MAEANDSPVTISDLFVRIARDRAELEALTVNLSQEQLAQPRKDGWGIKDHLIHLAAWEAGTAALLRREPRYAAMGIELGDIAPNDFDAINNLIYSQNKNRSVDSALEYFHATHMDLLNELAKMSDADLQKPYSYYQPLAPKPKNDFPVLGWIAGNTFEHYAEHIAWIREMLKT